MTLIVLVTLTGCGGSSEQSKAKPSYPDGNIKIIVPFSPGGSTDLMARVLAPEISKRLGDVSVVVENKGGGGGAPGMMALAQSDPDGLTLVLTSVSSATLTPNNTKVGYTNKEFIPIAQICDLATGIYVRADSGINSLEELIAKAEKNHGHMTFSTGGAGGVHHITGELFMSVLNEPGLFTHVPFDGGTEAITALLGNQVDFCVGDAGDGLAHVQEGTLKMLAVATAGEDPFFPDVPSFKDLGYDLVMGPWFGFAAPAGTPDDIIKRLDATIKECLQVPEVIAAFEKLGQPIVYLNHDDFSAKWMANYDANKITLGKLNASK
jgi:tripartite-type tricarboxylate transporter receptor subunit TctC